MQISISLSFVFGHKGLERLAVGCRFRQQRGRRRVCGWTAVLRPAFLFGCAHTLFIKMNESSILLFLWVLYSLILILRGGVATPAAVY